MAQSAIYVETAIRTSMADLWHYTQTPELHSRWDLRFTDIRYLPRGDEAEPQRFLYETRIGFGLRIAGEGEAVGTREDEAGMRTSVLKFWSDNPKSLIRSGSGYWQYVPFAGGIQFITRYDYDTRFGLAGRVIDRLLFRPLLGWATAWSFDRLRLWLEDGTPPATSLERTLTHGVARVCLAGIWLYQGIVPKLLYPDSGELEILRSSWVFAGSETWALTLIGWLEAIFGGFTLVRWRDHWPLWGTPVLLVLLLLGAVLGQPSLLVAPFNPVTLTGAMIALATIALTLGRKLPSASNCLRRPGKRGDTRE